jgi:hypothetical protein
VAWHKAEYTSWRNMMRRCFNPSDARYADWGGRGVTVAPEMQTFHCFIEVLGRRPKGLTLDRIDNNGNYERGNVRWATRFEQAANTRVVDLITWQGKTQPLSAWAREFDMPQRTLWYRLYRHNWSIDKALTTPVPPISSHDFRVTNRKLTDDDILWIAQSELGQSEMARHFGIHNSVISKIRSGKRWGKLTGLSPQRP